MQVVPHSAETPPVTRHDVLVIGGGPAGTTAALRAARHGLDVLVVEQDRHPRFRIGESLLPRNMQLLRELGLSERLLAVPHTGKLGASFALGHDERPTDFHFRDGLLQAPPDTLNVERAGFDAALFDAARDAGARTLDGATVRRISRLDDGDCVVEISRGVAAPEIHRAGWVVDASGQATVVARHLGTRRALPDLKKVAYYEHFTGVYREDGERGGYPLIVMCQEGWFWLIPIDVRRTSIGLVLDADAAKRVGVPSKQMLAWGISRCPLVRKRTEHAVFPERNRVTADFSYTCKPYAGPGYFLVGDAATFVDPIFSTGVCLSMMSAVAAADAIRAVHVEGRDARRVRRDYARFVDGSSSVFFRLVRGYYKHAFRELFLNRTGPLQVHRAVISVLAGHVFPRPPAALRWRLALFGLCVRLQHLVPLVPRKQRFYLLRGGDVSLTPVRGQQ